MKRASKKRVRRTDQGDWPEGHPMAVAVDAFRASAKLHLNSPDRALVVFAHGPGSERAGADALREAFRGHESAAPDESALRAPLGDSPLNGSSRSPDPPVVPYAATHGASQAVSSPEGDRESEQEATSARAILDACPHETQGRAFDGDRYCVECGLVFETKRARCTHAYSSEAVPDSDPMRIAKRCLKCDEWARCRTDEHHGICDNGSMVYCTTCGEIIPPESKQRADYEITDLGVKEVIVHSPYLEDVEKPELVERRATAYRYIGLDDPEDANDNAMGPDDEVLF